MSHSTRSGHSTKAGFSLLELLVVVSLLGVFLVAIYQTVIVGLRAVDDAAERAKVRQQLTVALDRLTREARMTKVVDTAKADEFQFDADFDGDGSSSDTETNIKFRLRQGDFERKQGNNAAVVLISGVDSVIFDYRDLNDSDLSPSITGPSKADIRLLQVTIVATLGDETITVDNAAYLGNM